MASTCGVVAGLRVPSFERRDSTYLQAQRVYVSSLYVVSAGSLCRNRSYMLIGILGSRPSWASTDCSSLLQCMQCMLFSSWLLGFHRLLVPLATNLLAFDGPNLWGRCRLEGATIGTTGQHTPAGTACGYVHPTCCSALALYAGRNPMCFPTLHSVYASSLLKLDGLNLWSCCRPGHAIT